MEEIRNLLDEEIKAEIEALSSLTFGSKEHLTATENLATLYKLRVDETKQRWTLRRNRKIVKTMMNSRRSS